ncbi:unnamed protein product [Paramecium primaurelia]|uniref:Tubulin-tyrosine ligase family protein n=1 Tax=Paramecium primaurelia TaxID=5886 RepID=A0A8S1JQM4_PARPR|nr:unnamed protein product [Paramecium primaurelia]
MYNNNELEKLVIKGSTRFQEVNFNQPRLFQPKLNIIKLKGFQQIVDLIKQQESFSKHNQIPQNNTQKNLPSILVYPPKAELITTSKKEISIRKYSETRVYGRKSFTETAEPHSLERRRIDTKRNKFAIKKPLPNKQEEQNMFENPNDFATIVSYSNLLMIIPQEKIVYKAFITKGNNGQLVRQLIKSRSWWILIDSPSNDMNLYWTQLRKQGFYKDLITITGNQSTFTKAQKKQVYDKFKLKLEEEKYSNFVSSNILRVHNHLEGNFQISNKKALYYNMKSYYESIGQDPFKFIPLTFHIQDGIKDPVYQQFEEYARRNNINVWIIKPGEQSNRGNGIEVANSISQVKRLVSYREIHSNGVKKTFIVQQYINKPLLYNKRKFDIRCFMLITCINHQFKAYWYQEGYIRTSCKEFNLDDTDCKYTHLTNDAVQKYSKNYGKYETGNKVSFNDFTKYVQEIYNLNFNNTIEQLKSLCTDIVKASYQHLDPNRHFYTFELFGLDFMIDSDFKPWLIEVNTNPCLETCCPLLTRLINHLVENTIRIAIDPMYPPPSKKKPLPEFKNNFELIFNTPLKEQCGKLPEIQQDDDDLDVDDDN